MLRVVDALEDLNYNKQEWYLVAIEFQSAKFVSLLRESLAIKTLFYKAFEVPIKPKWVKLNIFKEPMPPSTENKALNVVGESLKSLLKKLAYLRAKSFKLQV